MTSRQIWFKNRINECIEELSRLNKIEDWIEFKNQSHDLACELLYATTEWDKYYRNIQGK
jgi:hypothetical protein